LSRIPFVNKSAFLTITDLPDSLRPMRDKFGAGQRQRDKLESGWSSEPVEAEATKARPKRLEGILAAKGKLKPIRGC